MGQDDDDGDARNRRRSLQVASRRSSTSDAGDEDEWGVLPHHRDDYAVPKDPLEPVPRNPPLSPIVSVERQAYVDRLWRLMYSEEEIAVLVARHFNAGRQTTKNDLKEIQRRYLAIEREPNTIASRKAKLRASLELLYRHSLASGDRASARYVLDRLAKLDGLYAPIKIETTERTVEAVGLSLDRIVAALETDEELRAFEIVVAALERAGVSKPISSTEGDELGANAIEVEDLTEGVS